MKKTIKQKVMANTGNAENMQKIKRSSLPGRFLAMGMHKEPGIDGILVTVGLCIIALLLCMVMKESLAGFIEAIVLAMTEKAKNILGGAIF